MANPLYRMLNGEAPAGVPFSFPGMGSAPGMSGGTQFNNPVQKMQYILQAMTNPAAFVRQHFPDIPAGIQNNPNQILNYLQQTRGISNQQIQQAQQMAGQIIGEGTVR